MFSISLIKSPKKLVISLHLIDWKNEKMEKIPKDRLQQE